MDTTPNKTPTTTKSGHKTVTVVLILILIIAASASWLVLFSHGNVVLKNIMGGNNTAAQATTITQAPNKITEQTTRSEGLQQSGTVPTQEIADNFNDANVAEIIRLIKMANLTLTTTGDIKATLALLLSAKQLATSQRLAELNYVIAKDIATLQTNTNSDIFNIISRLDIINQQIQTLPTIPQQKSIITVITTKPKPAESSWHRVVNTVFSTLKDIVVVRRQTVEPLPLPEQMVTVRLNIQTKVLQAEWAAIHKNNQLYQASLNQVSAWISQYFALDAQNTMTLLNTIKELQKIDLQTEQLTLNASLQAIANFAKPAPEKPKSPDTVERTRLL